MSGQYKGEGVRKTDILKVTSLGDGLRLNRTRVVQFDHDFATWLLEKTEEFPGDRALKNRHVEYLISTMQRGTFHPEWVVIITAKCDGKVYRMNGQHTAWARIHMPAKWPCEVKHLEYEAKSMEDVRTLYSSIDRSSPRTRANVIESYLAGTPEFDGVKARTLRVVPQGFTFWFWKSKTERSAHDGDDVAYLLKTDWYDLAKKVCAFLDAHSPKEHWHVFRAPVIAAMFATFHKAPQIAVEFWKPVADGVGIEQRSDPRLKLRNELMQAAVGIGGGGQSDKKKVAQEVMFRNCILAWNAHREGRTLSVLRGTERGNRPGLK
jgi:hypothetical protein